MRKICKLIIPLIAIYMLICPVIALENQSNKEPVTYRIIIDQNYGFYRIYEIHDKISTEDIYAENGMLNISKGDTVVLVNGAVSDNIITVISDEQLWNDEDVILKYSGREFSYTFDNSGIYNIYIKEHPSLKQRIIVGPIDIVSTTDINGTKSDVINDTELDHSNITEATQNSSTTEATQNSSTTGNVTNDTELDLTNITDTNSVVQNSAITDTNVVVQNSTNITDANVVVQNSTNITERKSVQISILGKSSAFVRTAILLVVLTSSAIYFLSVRIKEN